MKRLMLVLAVGAAALAGCDEPRREQTETAAPPIEAASPPVPAETVPPPQETTTPEPGANTALPPDQRASEETVNPESETLFY